MILKERRGGQGRVAYVGGSLIHPTRGVEGGGLLLEDGKILDVGPSVTAQAIGSETEAVDCRGLYLAPGLVDMRVFTGEPGFEHRETLATASQAAARGGVTRMIVQPNTHPVVDTAALVDFILRRARDTASVRVAPMAAATVGLKGEAMTEIGLLQEAGAVGITDGTRAVANAQLFLKILSYARDFDLLVCQHVEEPTLATGVMAQGSLATRLGLSGNPWISEIIMLERDLRLVEYTKARYHASQISCRQSVEKIRDAKAKGLPVSCGVSINHLLLNTLDIGSYRTFFKLSPPLRSEDDRQALLEGVRDGTIDVIASGHDPQDADTKRLPFSEAAFGASGLDTFLPALLSLVHQGILPLHRVFEAASTAPCRLLNLEGGTLEPGAVADVIVCDLECPWQVSAQDLKSRSKNSVFEGHMFQGQVLHTLVAGRSVFSHTHSAP